MHPNSAPRIGTGQLASDLQSAKAHWDAANQAPNITNLMTVATDATGLIVDVQTLTRDKNRLLTAAQAVIDALHDGRPGPVSDLAALLADLGALTSPSPVLVAP